MDSAPLVRRRCRGTGRREPRCGCRTTPAGRGAGRRRADPPATMSSATPATGHPAGWPPTGRTVPTSTSPTPGAVQVGEVDVGGRPAAPGRRIVDDVVVHQCAGVQQFQRREQQQDPVVHAGVGLCGHRPVSPVGERGPHAFAAAQDEVLESCDEPVVVGADVGGVGARRPARYPRS